MNHVPMVMVVGWMHLITTTSELWCYLSYFDAPSDGERMMVVSTLQQEDPPVWHPHWACRRPLRWRQIVYRLGVGSSHSCSNDDCDLLILVVETSNDHDSIYDCYDTPPHQGNPPHQHRDDCYCYYYYQ